MKNRTMIGELKDKVGQTVTVAGWVDGRRDHGKLIFLDLRDASGKVQAVAIPANAAAHTSANLVRPEWVISATGLVQSRRRRSAGKSGQCPGQPLDGL